MHWTGWEFPKGGVELFETKKMTVKREIKEETGLNTIKIITFNSNISFIYEVQSG